MKISYTANRSKCSSYLNYAARRFAKKLYVAAYDYEVSSNAVASIETYELDVPKAILEGNFADRFELFSSPGIFLSEFVFSTSYLTSRLEKGRQIPFSKQFKELADKCGLSANEDAEGNAAFFDKKVIYISFIGVSEEYRNKGIAKGMLEKLLKHIDTNSVVITSPDILPYHSYLDDPEDYDPKRSQKVISTAQEISNKLGFISTTDKRSFCWSMLPQKNR